MATEPIVEPVNNPVPPTGSEPIKTEGNPPVQDDKMIPKHRFDEVNTRLRELQTWKTEQEKKSQEAEEKRLAEQGEFQKLAEQKTKEAEDLRQQLNQKTIDAEIREKARALGAVDMDAVLKLIDTKGVTLQEDGTIAGAEEAVKALIEAKPYLKGSGAQPVIGSPMNPGSEPASAKRFSRAQVEDVNFYREHQAEIDTAVRLGMIDG